MQTVLFLRQRWNSVALVLAGVLASTSSHAQVNSWVNPASGNWDDASSWSLGVPPGSAQSVMITNLLWKAVTIDSSTVSSFPQSLAVNSLTLLSLTNNLYTSKNTLLLNYAGAGNPLVIGVDSNTPGSLVIDSNSAVAMFSSGLIVNNALGTTNTHLGEFEVDGTFTQSDSSEVVAGFLDLNGTYNLTNGELFVGTQFINGTFNQQGGRNLGSVDMESTNGDYELFDGVVQGNVAVRSGTFHQRSGTNSAALITGFRGVYNLAGGLLMPGDLVVGSPPQNFLQFAGGGIEQTGGTNNAGNISMVFGFYNLRGGALSAQSLTLTTNILLGGLYAGSFNQFGGYQTNGGITMRGGRNEEDAAVTASYNLNGGTLETPTIDMDLAGFNQHSGTNRVGTLSMGIVGTYVIDGGLLVADRIQIGSGSAFYHIAGGSLAGMKNVLLGGNWIEQSSGVQLGQLQITMATNSFLYFPSSPCVIQFEDSTGMEWGDSGRLTIQNWQGLLGGGGSQQLIFGTSASGLTSQQLSQVQFSNPTGLPNGTYAARILSNGEVVPDASSSSSGPVNSWINPGSGNWDQSSNWSLGVLPDSPQSVLIANSGSKAVSINSSTAVNFPFALTVNNLFIEGGTNTTNTLLLNNIGSATPLIVVQDLTLRDGGQILNFNSGLIVQYGTFMVTNSDIIQDGGFIAASAPMYLSGSTYDITNGTFEAGSVAIGYPVSSHFNQYGGSVTITNLGLASYIPGTIPNGISLYGGTLDLPDGMSLLGESGGISYFQAGGTNRTGQVTIEPDYGGFVGGFTLNGGLLADSGVELMPGYETPIAMEQNGGSHVITNTLLLVGGATHGISDPTVYHLNGGNLSAGMIELDADQGDTMFVQSNAITSAGTVYAHSLGYYSSFNTTITLAGGTLSCSNYITDDGGGSLNQSGGALVVSNLLDFGGSRVVGGPMDIIYGHYSFTGGTVTASNINVSADWIIGDGSSNRISNPGFFSLSYMLQISNAVEQLGRFVLASNATIDLAGSASKLSFANSSAESWNGGAVLNIVDWNGALSGGGAEQLRFGTNASGVSAGQLSQIQFSNPAGLPAGTYPGQILATGEIVPSTAVQSVGFAQQGNNLILNWPQGWTLQTATNATGPFQDMPEVTSPYTNDMHADPQRFFRLRK